MNYLWAGMILIGIIFGAFNGRMEVITNAALDSSKEAVTLCITMIGIMSFWCGIMEIAEKAGLVKKAAEKLRPVIRFLFPQLPVGNKANEQIAINFIANILGLGWAATPESHGSTGRAGGGQKTWQSFWASEKKRGGRR